MHARLRVHAHLQLARPPGEAALRQAQRRTGRRQPVAHEVGARRPGRAAGGHILDAAEVVPGAQLRCLRIEHERELRSELGQPRLEIVAADGRARQRVCADRHDQVRQAGGHHLQRQAGVEIARLQPQGGKHAGTSHGGQRLAELRDALVHLGEHRGAAQRGAHAEGAGRQTQLPFARGLLPSQLVMQHGGRAKHRMAGEIQLFLDGEDARRGAIGRHLAEEDGLELAHLLRQRLHALGRPAVGVEHDRQAVARERARGEDVDVGVAGHQLPTRPLRIA